MNAKEVFEIEWSMYLSHGAKSDGIWGRKGKDVKGDESFDGDVKPGEIRIFADMERPFIALVVESKGLSGWTILPLSPFTVPASPREMLVGERVFQLWNACTAAKSFVARSWVVDTVSDDDLSDIKGQMTKVTAGRITSGDSNVAEYERKFLVTGGTFDPMLSVARQKGGVGTITWKMYGGWSAVAILLVCLGVTWSILNNELESQNRILKTDSARTLASVPEPASASVPARTSARSVQKKMKTSALRELETRRMMRFARTLDSVPEQQSMGFNEPVADVYGRERYAEFQKNEFVDVVRNPLSTFGLDVDTASYTTMRRYLTDLKRLPPKDSVRLEEYVNYFNYSYAEPTGGVPIAVDCELAACPWAKDHKLLRVGVQAKNIAKKNLPPSNLVFLLDVSGSMFDSMNMLKSSMRLLVNELRPQDTVSIVTYACGTAVRLPATSCKEKEKIISVIDSLNSGGGTAGGAGLQLAYNEAMKNFDKKANNRVILMTDGDFNIGINNHQELVRFIEAKRESGVFLTVLGVGSGNYQDEMMKRLSNAGNGNYAFIDSILEAKKVLMTEFGGSMYTVAKDVKLQLEFNPTQAAAYRLLGYESRKLAAKDFNDDKKDAGEIGVGHTMTVLYEIVPVGVAAPSGRIDELKYQKQTAVKSRELLTVKLRYKEPDGDASKLIETPIVTETITRKNGPSEDYRFASAVAECALIFGDDKFKGTASLKSVIERAKGAKGVDENGYRAEFIRLIETADLLKSNR
jgi:Ca-activated chloride channel family protein